MGEHALLAASAAHRWMNCPESVHLNVSIPDRGSAYAAEGTDAHTLCEHKLKAALGMSTRDPTGDLSYYNQEMEDCAIEYAAFINELLETAKQRCRDPKVAIEQRVHFSPWVADGFGTADCIILCDGTVHLVDFKYGQGIAVTAEGNVQLLCYALGIMAMFDGIYDITDISMTIFQPRRSNVSTATISKDALYQWAEETLKPAAILAFSGEGGFQCGDWCGFCGAKQICRARADANMELARYDFKPPPLLEDSEVEDILGRIDGLISWASDIKEYALKQALSGKVWNGWKLVEGRATRKYTDETAIAEVVKNAGCDPYEHKVLGITNMQKVLGKARFDDLLSPYITRPQGKPTLVPDGDKRPEMNTASQDFMEESDHA